MLILTTGNYKIMIFLKDRNYNSTASLTSALLSGKKRKSQTHPNVHIKYMYLSEANIQLIKHHDSFITFGNIDQYFFVENPYFYSKKCFSFVYIDVILFG